MKVPVHLGGVVSEVTHLFLLYTLQSERGELSSTPTLLLSCTLLLSWTVSQLTHALALLSGTHGQPQHLSCTWKGLVQGFYHPSLLPALCWTHVGLIAPRNIILRGKTVGKGDDKKGQDEHYITLKIKKKIVTTKYSSKVVSLTLW